MKKVKAFTLAEALATLGVIGVVATFLIPAVIIDVRDNMFKAQKQGFITNFKEAIRMVDMKDGAINKASSVTETKDENGNVTHAAQTETENFLKEHLANSLTLARVCDSDDLESCGFLTTTNNVYQYPNGGGMVPSSKFSSIATSINASNDTWGAITGNGVSMYVSYNKNCKGDILSGTTPVESTPCINIIYDVNGSDAPNIVGKDVGFLTVFGNKNPRVGAPLLHNIQVLSNTNETKGLEHCEKFSKRGDLGLPTYEEGRSISINYGILNPKASTTPKILTSNQWKHSTATKPTTGDMVCVGR